jgi:hypothetical protein
VEDNLIQESEYSLKNMMLREGLQRNNGELSLTRPFLKLILRNARTE